MASTALWLRPLADRVPATASGVKFARVLVAALTFFPALALGPIAEALS